MSRDLTHPVWNVYNEYKRARLNVRYYCARLARLERIDLILDVLIAGTTTGSAIATLTVWDSYVGAILWKGLAGVAALAAVIKPFLKLSDRIKKHEEVITGFRVVEHDLRKLTIDIEQRRAFDTELAERFQRILDRTRDLAAMSVESGENLKLISKLTAQVNRELPADSLYLPAPE